MKKFNPLTKLAVGAAIGALSLLASKPANAALLAQYMLDNNLNNSAPAVTGLSVSQFQDGAGLSGARFVNRSVSGQSRLIDYSRLAADSKTTALTGETYYSFTLTPQSTRTNRFGTRFETLTFFTNVGDGTQADRTGNFFVQANLGAGNTFVDVSTTYTQPPSGTNFALRTVDLTGFTTPFYNGYFTQPVEFRIYQFDNGSNNTNGGLRVDNVELQGEVAPVPELSTSILMLLALGGLGAMSLRRKKTGTVPMRLAI